MLMVNSWQGALALLAGGFCLGLGWALAHRLVAKVPSK